MCPPPNLQRPRFQGVDITVQELVCIHCPIWYERIIRTVLTVRTNECSGQGLPFRGVGGRGKARGGLGLGARRCCLSVSLC